MALQLRRGSSSGLSGVIPDPGELIYTTDTKLVYVGDGSTAGGTAVSGGGSNDIVNDTTPQLGGNLDVNGRSIVSASNGNININPDGTGNIVLHGNLTIDIASNISKTGILSVLSSTITSFGSNDTLNDGNIRIVRNTHSSATSAGISFEQHHEVVDAVNFNFVRTRGTGLVQLSVINGDELGDIGFVGHDGTNRVSAAVITARIAGPVSLGVVPGELVFTTRNSTGGFSERAMLSSEGVWKTNTITALTTNQNLGIAANGTGSVGLDGILFKASTMTMPPQNAQPVGVAGMMAVCDGTAWNGGGDSLQHLMIYINGVWTVVV